MKEELSPSIPNNHSNHSNHSNQQKNENRDSRHSIHCYSNVIALSNRGISMNHNNNNDNNDHHNNNMNHNDHNHKFGENGNQNQNQNQNNHDMRGNHTPIKDVTPPPPIYVDDNNEIDFNSDETPLSFSLSSILPIELEALDIVIDNDNDYNQLNDIHFNHHNNNNNNNNNYMPYDNINHLLELERIVNEHSDIESDDDDDDDNHNLNDNDHETDNDDIKSNPNSMVTKVPKRYPWQISINERRKKHDDTLKQKYKDKQFTFHVHPRTYQRRQKIMEHLLSLIDCESDDYDDYDGYDDYDE